MSELQKPLLEYPEKDSKTCEKIAVLLEFCDILKFRRFGKGAGFEPGNGVPLGLLGPLRLRSTRFSHPNQIVCSHEKIL